MVSGKKWQTIHLKEKNQWLDAIDVQGQHRHFESEVTESQALHHLDLERNRGVVLGQALEQLPGVFSIRSGPTLYKPMMQGLSGMRVAVVQNGVKLEGQQWGSDHAPEIDPDQSDEIIVVKGAQTIRYGSEAIGGIVLLEPGEVAPTTGIRGKWSGSFQTNGRGFSQAMSLEGRLGKKKAASWRIRAKGMKSGTIHAPAYYLGNTGSEEASGQVLFRLPIGPKWESEWIYSHFATRIGIFNASHTQTREGLELAFVRPDSSFRDEFSYQIDRPFQQVRHQIFKGKMVRKWGKAHETTFQYAHQTDLRQEFDRVRMSARNCSDCPQLLFRLQSRLLEIRHHIRTEGKEFQAGLSGNYIANEVERYVLIPNFRQNQGSAFVLASWFPGDWAFEAGLRTDMRRLQVFRYAQGILERPVRNFVQTMANIGARLEFSDHWHAKANYSFSQRAPHVSELYAFGVHLGSAGMEVGDPGLRPERIQNVTMALHHRSHDWELVVSAFGTYSPDFIYLSPWGDSLASTIRGTYPLFQYRQSEVRLLGSDFQLKWNFRPAWEIQIKGSLIRARNLSEASPLVWQPSDRMGIHATWSSPKTWHGMRFKIGMGPQWVDRQRRVPADLDFLPPPPAYFLWEAKASISGVGFRIPFDFSLEVRNLTNNRYREYLNRFRYFGDEPGRNLIFRLLVPFNL